MKRQQWLLVVSAVIVGVVTASWWHDRTVRAEETQPIAAHVQAQTPVEAGRYLVRIAGCNDCHTPGWRQKGAAVPENDWLTGVPIGWHGPWGTTYAPNLRLYAQQCTQRMWIMVLRSRKVRPPMPWTSVNAMSDADLAAIYQFLRHLGPKGHQMPDYLPPGVQPTTPYINLKPVLPKSIAAKP